MSDIRLIVTKMVRDYGHEVVLIARDVVVNPKEANQILIKEKVKKSINNFTDKILDIIKQQEHPQ